jgi:hypothetical protein
MRGVWIVLYVRAGQRTDTNTSLRRTEVVAQESDCLITKAGTVEDDNIAVDVRASAATDNGRNIRSSVTQKI